MDKPSIETFFGYCLGGGLELPLACHFRIAAVEGAKIGLPEMDLGGVPAWGGTARLTRCVGRDAALDMILRAKKIDGPEALRIGLVQEVHPLARLKDAAQSIARELASMPPIAVLLIESHSLSDPSLRQRKPSPPRQNLWSQCRSMGRMMNPYSRCWMTSDLRQR